MAQFAFGFYSLMLTSNLIGWIVMALFKPRSWCVFCPMGTMTQLICKLRAPREDGGQTACSVNGCVGCAGCGKKEA